MNEKNTLIINSNSIENSTAGSPKTTIGLLIRFFAKKFDAVSRFVHRWAKP